VQESWQRSPALDRPLGAIHRIRGAPCAPLTLWTPIQRRASSASATN